MGFFILRSLFFFQETKLPSEPFGLRAMAFFDVQNLYQHAKEAFGHHHPNFDPVKLHKAVCEANRWRFGSVRFYTGVPAYDRAPMWHGYWSARILALKRAGVHVTTRPLRYHAQRVEHLDGSVSETVTPHEKGIDIRLALDLVSMARKSNFDVAVIYSQDQDLAEVVEEIREIAAEQNRRISIASAFPFGPRSSSTRGINRTDWFRMDEAFYNACLDPRDYRPSRS